MKQIALIEKGADGTYSIYTAHTISTIVGEGQTVAEAKADFELALQEYYKTYQELGEEIPEEMRGAEIEYKYDIPSLFNNFDFINVSKFARYAGINASLLRQYKTGDTYISEAQAKKIESALHRIGEELTAISL